jgi:hypothetical protein
MSTPIYIAVNLTESNIVLSQLRLTVPASGQINLSNFNETWRIQSDQELREFVQNNSILINDGTSTLSKTVSLQYISPPASKGDLTNVSAHADETTWTTVSSVLGNRASTNTNYVFKSNGLGGGEMVPNTSEIARTISVGLSGDVNYNSIVNAVNAAVSGGANANYPWEILVYAGTYTEGPFTLPAGIYLKGGSYIRSGAVSIVAENAAADLITMTGGAIFGIKLSGVTDPAHCLIRSNGTSSTIQGIGIENCSNGIIIENNSLANIDGVRCIVNAANQSVTNVITINDSQAFIGNLFAVVPSAVLPLYSSNPITNVLNITNDGYCHFYNSVIMTSNITNDSNGVFADGGSVVTISNVRIENGSNGVRIGTSGSNTSISLSSVLLENNYRNVLCESSTGSIYFIGSFVRGQDAIMAEGSTLTGIDISLDENICKLIGNIRYQFESGKLLEMRDFLIDFGHGGVCEGGLVTVVNGLEINISHGEGFIRRGDPYEDIESVTWNSTNLTLPPNSTNYVYYNSTSNSVIYSDSAPGETGILFATIITGALNVKHNHKTIISAIEIGQKIQQYLVDTRTQVLKSGLAAIQETSREFSVDAGSYYYGLDVINYDGYDGYSSWTYYYGSNGVGELENQTQTDLTRYDSNGVLTTMSDGYYRKDYLVLTSDGKLSLIYGTSQYSTLIAVEEGVTELVPTFLQYSDMPIAEIVVQRNVGIIEILDKRPVKSWSTGSGTITGVTDHNELAGLSSDDHIQYLLASGSRPLTGDLNIGGHNITNVGFVNSVNISEHANRHNPGGEDSLSVGLPVTISVGASPSSGTGSSYSLNDHQHGISTGIPVTINNTNSAGTASSVSRSDHIHAHGNQPGESLHAIATTSSAGFMSSTDKISHDILASGNITIRVYNNNIYTLQKGRAIAPTGWYDGYNVFYINYADKDDPALRPSIGLIQSDILPNSFGSVITKGYIDGLDTSQYDLTAMLVLGNDGYLIYPPPDTNPFTGEVQNLAVVSRVNLTDGVLSTLIDGMIPITGPQILALEGTSGTPDTTNRYVTNSDNRLTQGVAGSQTVRSLGTGVTQACAGNDSRLSDDRTASGLRTATTIVSINTAIAPSSGQVLTAASDTSAIWVTPLALTNVSPSNVTKSSAIVGVSSFAARSDHKHDISTTTASSLSVGGNNAEGSSTSLARADHLHALPSFGTTAGTFCQGNDSRLSDDRTASGLRTATTIVSINTAAAPVSGQVLSATSNTSAEWTTPLTLTNVAPANITKSTALVGTATSVARADHKHDITTAVPSNIGTTNQEGVSTALARADHIHKGTLLQTIESSLSSNITTTSDTFTTLLSTTMITGDGYIVCNFTASGDNSAANREVLFRLVVDSTTIRGCGFTVITGGAMSSTSLQRKLPVSAGSHTITIQWRVSGGTGRINVVSNENHHASVIVQEILY